MHLNATNIETEVLEQYSIPYRTFIRLMTLRHVFTLTTDCVILLRRSGVRSTHEKDIIERSFSPSAPAHQRYGLSDERAHVRKEYKVMKGKIEKGKGKASAPLSDSDVEIVEIPKVSRKRHAAEVDFDSDEERSRRRRPHLTIDTRMSPINVDTISPSPSTIWSAHSVSTPATTPPPSATSESSSAVVGKALWKRGLYAIDMVTGFQKMDSDALAHLSKADRFAIVFGQGGKYRFSAST